MLVCYPMAKLTMDIAGPFKLNEIPFKYMLIAVYYFSKYIEIFPLLHIVLDTVC